MVGKRQSLEPKSWGGSNVWLSGANAGGLRSKQHKVVRGRNTRDDGTEPSINSIEAWWKNKKVKRAINGINEEIQRSVREEDPDVAKIQEKQAVDEPSHHPWPRDLCEGVAVLASVK